MKLVPLGRNVQLVRSRAAMRSPIEWAVLPRAPRLLEVNFGPGIRVGGIKDFWAKPVIPEQQQFEISEPAWRVQRGAIDSESLKELRKIGFRKARLREHPDSGKAS
jgi:hypothetical protein